jgi:hypothetical protein
VRDAWRVLGRDRNQSSFVYKLAFLARFGWSDSRGYRIALGAVIAAFTDDLLAGR